MSITPREPADFTPSRGNYTELKPFRFWCQKVLPLVYDDSLSYYELLCKVVDFLNKTMEDVETLEEDVTGLHTAYVELQTYVNDYFSTLDVQEEINNKLDEMASNGELSEIIDPFLPELVSEWLEEHLTPTQPTIDNTLSITGAGADSKKTGDAISIQYNSNNKYKKGEFVLYQGDVYRCIENIEQAESWNPLKWTKTDLGSNISYLNTSIDETNNEIKELEEYVNFYKWNLISNLYAGGIIDNNGNINTDYPTWSYTDYIEIIPNIKYTECSTDGIDTEISGGVYIAFYDSNKNFINREGGNNLTITTPSNSKYARLSVQTAYSDKLVFGCQGLRLQIPEIAKPFNNLKTFNWKNDYAVLISNNNIIKYNNNNYKTTEYIQLNKGDYVILPVTDGGMYLTKYDENLQAISNEPISSNTTYRLVVNSNIWITISILKSQNTNIISESSSPIKNKKICFYGDSITCLGNDFRSNSWQGIMLSYFSFTDAISVGIGGSRLCWRDNERYNFDNHVLGTNLPYGATRVTGNEGTVASMCSWERIEKTIPEDCDLVFIMGGTNDAYTTVSGSTEMSASNITDSAWVNSDSYTGGDYDISTINGAILSIIMKIHIRCPNALVIMCTPLSGRGDTSGANQLNYASWDMTHNICNAIKDMSNYMSTPCFDLFGNSGITPYNRATYMSDTVHPNDNGMKMIARYLIEKFNIIYPKI